MAADYSGIYDAAGQKYNVDPLLLQSIAQHESGQQTTDAQGRLITSSAGAQGIMQFMPATAKTYGVDVSDPVSSIMGGAHYISDLLKANKGNVVAALAQYGGYSNPQQAMQYAQSVAGNYQKLQGQHQPPPQSQPQGAPAAQAPSPDAATAAFGPPSGAGSQALQQPDAATKAFGAPGQPSPDVSVPGRSAGPAVPPPAPPQSWWQRNVSTPVAQIMDPTLPNAPGQTGPSPLLGVPLLSDIGSGAVQGVRNVANNINRVSAYVDQRYPMLSDLDKAAVARGLISDPATSQIPAQTAAQRQQYAGNPVAGAAEIAAPIIMGAAGPAGGAIGAPTTAANTLTRGALSFAPRTAAMAAPAVAGAVAGAGQNVLTSDQDPATAAESGAIGGAILGPLAGYMNPGNSAITRAADDLRIPLSLGQRGNYFAKNVEDLSQALEPTLSGQTALEGAQRGRINEILREHTGLPISKEAIDTPDMQVARANAGRMMDQSKNINIPDTDQQFLNELAAIDAKAAAMPTLGQNARDLVNVIQNNMAANNGTLPGAALHDIISHGGMLDTLEAGSQADKLFGSQIRETLLDAAERNGGAAYPEFQQGRYFWKGIKTIQDSVERSPGGTETISFPALKQAIFNARYFPNSDMANLGLALKGPLAEMKSSGTGRQLMWGRLLGMGGGYAGAEQLGPAASEAYTRGLMGAGATLGLGNLTRRVNPLVLQQTIPRAGAPYVGNLLTGQSQ